MKKLFGIVVLAAVMLSCSPKNGYEKAIADFVQTDKKGTFYDLKFKALEVKELQKITVADSITILTEKMESERMKQIGDLEERVKSNQTKLEKEQQSKLPMKAILDLYKNNIAIANQKIEELKLWNPGWTAPYESRAKEELLAIVVQCKYSLVPPTMNTTITETKNFVLTPDGKKCLSRSKAE